MPTARFINSNSNFNIQSVTIVKMLLISNTHVYTQDFFSHCSLVAIGPYLQDTQGPSRLEFDRLTSLNCVGGEGGGASVNLGEKIS